MLPCVMESHELPPQKPPKPSRPTTRLGRNPKLAKLVELQKTIENDILDQTTRVNQDGLVMPNIPSHVKAQLAKAWKDLEMLRRLMLGKPLSVAPRQPKAKAPRKLGSIIPLESPDSSASSQG